MKYKLILHHLPSDMTWESIPVEEHDANTFVETYYSEDVLALKLPVSETHIHFFRAEIVKDCVLTAIEVNDEV